MRVDAESFEQLARLIEKHHGSEFGALVEKLAKKSAKCGVTRDCILSTRQLRYWAAGPKAAVVLLLHSGFGDVTFSRSPISDVDRARSQLKQVAVSDPRRLGDVSQFLVRAISAAG